MNTKEIEARFLDIDKNQLIQKLHELDAVDKGNIVLEEIIFYDKDLKWRDEQKYVRLRKINDVIKLTYKENREQKIDSATEIEFEVSDFAKTELFLEKAGLVAFRHQQKSRHSFEFNGIEIDIDTWPKIPTYVELEGASEEAIKLVAEQLGFQWKDAVFDDARSIIEKRYHIPVSTYKHFTFDKCE